MPSTVLALDLATTTGWAWGEVGGTARFGAIRLGPPGADRGTRGSAMLVWLSDFFKIERPDLVVVEAPLAPAVMRRIGATNDTALMLLGLPMVVETVCHLRGVKPPKLVKVQDVREAFLGKRTFRDEHNPLTGKRVKSRAIAKSATMEMCRRLGYGVSSDDEADAIALWHYGCSLLNPRQAALMGEG
jgi:hypothetical protein